MVGTYNVNREHNLYVLSKDDIDFEAEQVLCQYYPRGLEEVCEIPVDEIIEAMDINLIYRKLSMNKEILGGCIFEKGKVEVYDEFGNKSYEVIDDHTIIINSDLVDDNDIRYGSSSGHELGHYVTQGDLFFKNKDQFSLFEPEPNETAIICKREVNNISHMFNKHKKLESKYDWMEWQANYFSTAITVPKKSLMKALDKYFIKYKDIFDKPLLENLESKELLELITNLSSGYNVSKELMANRLRNLELLYNNDLSKEVVTLWS